MSNHIVNSLHEYVQYIERIKKNSEVTGNSAELLFRGQRQDKPLLPKLARLKLKGSTKVVEKLMLEEFSRASLPLAEHQPENNWDLLALAQHHGLPTRLLDWSYSALIALWFAVHREPAEEENGVVWVLNAEVADFRNTSIHEDPLSNKATRIFRSRVISKRISSQAGAFTTHRIGSDGKIIPFESNRRFKNKIQKIVIPHIHFAQIRASLSLMGVNYASVFPDIDGLCSHLERRFSWLDDEI